LLAFVDLAVAAVLVGRAAGPSDAAGATRPAASARSAVAAGPVDAAAPAAAAILGLVVAAASDHPHTGHEGQGNQDLPHECSLARMPSRGAPLARTSATQANGCADCVGKGAGVSRRVARRARARPIAPRARGARVRSGPRD